VSSPNVPSTNTLTGISDYLNRVQKYVVSSTMTSPEWQNSTVLSGEPVEEVRALKEQPGEDIVVTGSITLCHTLIGAGLVDEYRLFVYPVVQGRGRRLFPEGFEYPTLRLVESEGVSERHHVLAIRPFLTEYGVARASFEATRPLLSNASHTAISAVGAALERWRASNKAGDTRRRQEWAERWP
jgi:dihydrofolate reductase